MPRKAFFYLTLLLAPFAAKGQDTPPASPFIDANLASAVRAALRLDGQAALTDDALKNLYFLEAPTREIKDLTGLEKCRNLALIRLTGNQITSVAPLAGLANLQSLDLAKNQISDLGPLESLTKLQYLELSDNTAESAAPLAKLENLRSLYLSGNKITDLAPLAGLTKLASLYLADNQVADIGPLVTVSRLSTLDLRGNQVKDLAPLKSQTELRMLFLEKNPIEDLGPLVEWAKADAGGAKRFAPYLRLYLGENPIPDDKKTEQTAALKEAGVRIGS